jgi:Flp pilus assembly pilin Flp
MLTLKRLTGCRGQALVEYVFIISLVALGALATFQLLGLALQQLYSTFPAAF